MWKQFFLARNRFNLRTTTTAAPAEGDSNAEEAPAPVSTSRVTRPRGSFSGSRSRFGGRSTTTTAAPEPNNESNEEGATVVEEPVATTRGRPTPRRFNIGNRLNRLHSAKKSTADEGDKNQGEGEEKPAEDSVSSTTVSSINRLRQRPTRLQVSEKPSNAAPIPPRRVNPLLARRRPGLVTTTVSTTIADGEEEISQTSDGESEKSSSENGDEALEAAENAESQPEPEKETPPSTTAAPLRGLALLQARRRQQRPQE